MFFHLFDYINIIRRKDLELIIIINQNNYGIKLVA